MTEPPPDDRWQSPNISDLPVGERAIRVFRAARRRYLALPPEQRPRLEPGLAQALINRGWDIPAHLLPEASVTEDSEDT